MGQFKYLSIHWLEDAMQMRIQIVEKKRGGGSYSFGYKEGPDKYFFNEKINGSKFPFKPPGSVNEMSQYVVSVVCVLTVIKSNQIF